MSRFKIQRSPTEIPTLDDKIIKEHFGLASIDNPNLSIAYMVAPAGWSEPFQSPEFEEYTIIIKGKKQIEIGDEKITLEEGQSIKIEKGVKVRYSNPFSEPCVYISVCSPAFSIDIVKREEQ